MCTSNYCQWYRTRSRWAAPLSALLLLLGMICFTSSAPVTKKRAYVDESVHRYLMKFGYLPQSDLETGNLRTEESLREAIRDMQRYGGLEPTGEIDAATMKLLATPRCGVADKQDYTGYRRTKRYTLQGLKWQYTNLTWSLRTKNPYNLDQGRVRAVLARALDVWAQNSKLTFQELDSDQADILVQFERGYHGDGYPFDGKGQILAHAFFPNAGRGGDAHFDEEETWLTEDYDENEDGTSLFLVAAHEFGHSLGLSHSSVEGALMFPWYQGLKPNFQLPDDDKHGIQQMYGSKEEKIWDRKPVYRPQIPHTTPPPRTTERPTRRHPYNRYYPEKYPDKPYYPEKPKHPHYPPKDPYKPHHHPDKYPERRHPDKPWERQPDRRWHHNREPERRYPEREPEKKEPERREPERREPERREPERREPERREPERREPERREPERREPERREPDRRYPDRNYPPIYPTEKPRYPQTRNHPVTEKPEKPNTCDTSYDAISVIRREVFIFKDAYLWRIGDNGLNENYPVEILRMWNGLPENLTNVDAVYERPDNKIVFFIGKQYFVHNGNHVERGYPKPLTNLGLPASLEKIDAAMVWGHNSKTYFYSGTMYWRFDEELGKVELDYPRDMSMWKGVGYNIDAVFQWKDGKTYFFKGKGFWKFNDLKMSVEKEQQMLSAPFWMGCPRTLEGPQSRTKEKFVAPSFSSSAVTIHLSNVAISVLSIMLLRRLWTLNT